MTNEVFAQQLRRVLQRTPDAHGGVRISRELATEMRRRGHLSATIEVGSRQAEASDYIEIADEPEDYIELADEPACHAPYDGRPAWRRSGRAAQLRRELEAFCAALNRG